LDQEEAACAFAPHGVMSGRVLAEYLVIGG
jgi:hypothetical protein